MKERHRVATRDHLAFCAIAACCVLASSCAKQSQPISAEQIENLNQQLGTVKPVERSSHRNPRAFELLNAQEQVTNALAMAKSPDERNVEIQLYGRFSRQLEVHQLILQQTPSAPSPRQSKISNGRPATPDQIPYDAAYFDKGSSPRDGQECGVTLIDPYWALTAGHCVGGTKGESAGNMCLKAFANPEDYQLFVGSVTLSNGGTVVDVDSFCVNPTYTIHGLHAENDIALVKLKTPAQVSRLANIPSVNTETRMFAYTRNALISGWGRTGPTPGGSDVLLFGIVQASNPNETPVNASCQAQYPSEPITSSMVCAASNIADTCYGDSGGPLIMRTKDRKEYVEGVTSWEEGQCGQGVPGVYTRVPVFAGWINAVTGVPID